MTLQRQSLRELVNEEFGTPVEASDDPEITEVGTTALEVLRLNPNRLGFTVFNLSSAKMYLMFSPRVSATNGFVLGPNGGFATFFYKNDAMLPGRSWWIIADAGASALKTVEYQTT